MNSLRDLCNPTKCTNIHVMGVREEEKEYYSKKNG